MGSASGQGEGTPFGRYRLITLLGKGGMGQVFRAYDTETDRVVALKVLPPQLARDDGFKERFRREAHAAARLSDPHVVPIHHFGEIDDQLYVDMRLIDGRDLGAVLNDADFTPQRAVAIVSQIASALNHAHQAGLVHRDVKPSNILVTDRDFAYLIDFGLVRATEDAALTATGFAMGTVSYMSPEQLSGRADARSDVYALTCVLFQCLTGRQPFTGDMRQKIVAHTTMAPPQPSRVRVGVSPAFDAVIAKGMAKDPDQRYQSALELAEAARAAVAAPARQAAPSQPPVHQAPPHPAWEPTQFGSQARMSVPPQYAPLTNAAPMSPQFGPGLPYGMPPGAAPSRQWWRRPGAAIGAGAVAALAIALVVVLVVVSSSGDASPPPPSGTSETDAASEPASIPVQDGKQTTLPFESLAASSVAVDGDGTVYVGIIGSWIVSLKANSRKQVDRKLDSRTSAYRMAVDQDGTIYMVDLQGGVASLAPGSGTPQPLPFPPLELSGGIALGADGAIYVADSARNKMLVLESGADAAVELPVSGLSVPDAIAVDANDNLYVAMVGGIVKFEKGAAEAEPVSGGPNHASALAVDVEGNLYTASAVSKKVLRLSVADGEWTELPFSGLELPESVAVDAEGNVYVLDGLKRVVKLDVE